MVEDNGGYIMSLQAILGRATEAQWEVYSQHTHRIDIQLRQRATEAIIRLDNTGYGIRVIIPSSSGAGVGYAACNSKEELETTARKAHDLAKINRSPFFELPTKRKFPSVKALDRNIVRDPEGTAKDYAEEAQAIISDEKNISLTYGKVRTYVVDTQIVNSRGLSCKTKGTYVYVEMTLKVGNGTSPTEFWPTRFGRRIDDLAPKKIIAEWVEIAKNSLKRHPPSTKVTTVILAPAVVCDIFVPTIGFHSTADALKRGLTQFKEGAKVAAEELTVVDDGLYPYGLCTNPFDDEGQPQQTTSVIERGVFRNYLHDQLHAHAMHAKPTGNGIRPKSLGRDVDERYQLLPEDATTNLLIKPGKQSLEELIRDVKHGIIVYHCAWINPDEITTRFGSEIRNAREIVNGKLGEAIVGGTMSGAATELIQKITGLSDTAEIVSGQSFGCVAPYTRVDGVQISGLS